MRIDRIIASVISGLGISTVVIGVSLLLLGPSLVVDLMAAPLVALGGAPPVTGLSHPNTDNEFRFYAVLLVAYGSVGVWAARDLASRMLAARGFLLVFFAGGLGRALSWFLVGAPHPLFQVLTGIALTLPAILFAMSFAVSREDSRSRVT